MSIAIGTAALAAVIVAADWDLAVIQAWQSLSAPNVGSHHRNEWSVATRVVRGTTPTRMASQCAANGPKLRNGWPRPEDLWADSVTTPLPATPLRDARRAERTAEAEAA